MGRCCDRVGCGEWGGLETGMYEDRTRLVVSCVPLKTPMTSTTDSSRDIVCSSCSTIPRSSAQQSETDRM